ncbi:xanthine dehydrogenase accessory protein XdhC [Nitratireductor sp. CH_MIT9313-5]|uniref:xanthine dehydrogenase accessory protein XdhC n=1 Tax=Nitratireductor sp. CH_MIT9313-5 TaxID=3107764 RepID=UPI00300A9BA6
MTKLTARLRTWLDANPRAAVIRVTSAKGSTPREEGAWMLVSPAAIFNTIGGGQLEFLAIAKARELIEQNLANGTMDVPLGPEIGQCCGGRVGLEIKLAAPSIRNQLLEDAAIRDRARPHVYLFGGGHVGQALSEALSLLPLHTVLVETRPEALEEITADVEKRLTPVPEDAVRSAPEGSAFVILTHDHALDFLIASEALARKDALYVGMIGSKTKRATFKSWYGKNDGKESDLARLTCPIGGTTSDKRPAVIAALAAAEVMRALMST